MIRFFERDSSRLSHSDPEFAKYCAHYSRPEIVELPVPGGAALISITDPGSERPAFRIQEWPDILELQFHDISSAQPQSESWWKSWAGEGYIVPSRREARSIAEFVRRHWTRTIIVHCEMGLSRSAAVCDVLVALGWGYQATRSEGRYLANRRLVQLLWEEFGLSP